MKNAVAAKLAVEDAKAAKIVAHKKIAELEKHVKLLRRAAGAESGPEPEPEPEPEPDSILAEMGVSSEEASAAASKVQAMQRGKLARRELKTPAVVEEADSTPAEAAAGGAAGAEAAASGGLVELAEAIVEQGLVAAEQIFAGLADKTAQAHGYAGREEAEAEAARMAGDGSDHPIAVPVERFFRIFADTPGYCGLFDLAALAAKVGAPTVDLAAGSKRLWGELLGQPKAGDEAVMATWPQLRDGLRR